MRRTSIAGAGEKPRRRLPIYHSDAGKNIRLALRLWILVLGPSFLATVLPGSAIHTPLSLDNQFSMAMMEPISVKQRTFSLILFLQYLHFTVCLMIASLEAQL